MALNARDLWFILRAKDDASSSFNKVTSSLLGTGAGAQKMSQGFMAAGRVLQTVGLGLITVGAVGVSALIDAANSAKDYQAQVALTKTQVDGFSASMQQLGDIGKQVASDIAVPFEQVQPALYNIFSSTNANLAQATLLLNAFAKASVAGAVDIDAASKGTMSILNGFHLPLEKVNDVLDIQFQLVRKGVGTYSQFNSVLGRIIPSANKAGQDFQTVAAMLAFMTRNGLSAAMASTAGARALDAFANPVTAKNLGDIGIKVSDINGNFLPLSDILGQLNTKMKDMSETKRSELLAQIFSFGTGGNVQALRFISQVLEPGQYQTFLGFLGDMNDATGQFGDAYAIMADTTANKSQLLKNNWDILKETAGELVTPYLLNVVDAATKVLQWFNDLDEPSKKFYANLLAIGSAASIAAGALSLAAAAVADFAGALTAMGLSLGKTFGIITIVVAALFAIGYGAYYAYTHVKEFHDFVDKLGAKLSEVYKNDIKPFTDQIKADFDDRLKPSLEHVKQSIEDLGNAIKDFFENNVKPHEKDLKEFLNWIERLWSEGFLPLGKVINDYVAPALHYLADVYEGHKKGIDSLIDKIEWLCKQFMKLGGGVVILLVIVVVLILVAALGTLVWIIAGVIDGVSYLVHWIQVAIEWIKKGWDWVTQWGDSFKGLKNTISNAIGDAGKAVEGLPGKIKNAAGSLANVLYQAGKDVINGLINGIKDSMGVLGSVLGGVGNFIKNNKGPASKDLAMLKPAGKLVMTGLINGIDSLTPELGRHLTGISGKIASTMLSATKPSYLSAPAFAPTAGGKYVTNNITVNQADRSAKQLAEELGFELAGSV